MITRPIALLTGAIAVVGANSMVLAPITAAVARDLGGEPAAIMQAAAAYGLTTALSAMFLAPRADMIGPDKALKQSMVILLISLFVSALAPSKGVLILAQAIGGIGAGMAIPAIYALAPQLGPKGQEKRSMGLVLSGWTLALVAGVAGSGFLAEWAGWRAVYIVLAALMLLQFLALLRVDMHVERIAISVTSPLTALQVPGISRGLFSVLMLMLGFYGTYAFLGAHVADSLRRGADVAGLLTLCYGVGFGLSSFLDPMMDRVSNQRAGAMAFGGLLAVYVAMAWLGDGLVPLALLAVLWGVAQHLALNAVVSRLAALDARQRGAILGLNSSVTYFSVLGGALILEVPYSHSGLMLNNLISAACSLVGMIECLAPNRKATN